MGPVPMQKKDAEASAAMLMVSVAKAIINGVFILKDMWRYLARAQSLHHRHFRTPVQTGNVHRDSWQLQALRARRAAGNVSESVG